MIQSILNLYPDCISEHGLLGCAFVTFLPIGLFLIGYNTALIVERSKRR